MRKAIDGTLLDSFEKTEIEQADFDTAHHLEQIKTPGLTRRMKKLVSQYVKKRTSKQQYFRLKDYFLDVYEHGFFDWARRQGQSKFHRIVEEQHNDL